MVYYFDQINRDLFKNAVVTVGNFDGVHQGHNRIINELLDISDKISGDSVIITFPAHPQNTILSKHIPVLTTLDEKINELHNKGISNIVLMNFTKKIASMRAVDFISEILIDKIDTKQLIMGYDHAFGSNREGNYETICSIMKEYGIPVVKVEPMIIGNYTVSSSLLRKEISVGNISFANEIIGRNYSFGGSVVYGDGRGRKIGFPTANIKPKAKDKLLPGNGVYSVIINIDGIGKKVGMMNIGNNPTFDIKERRIEINIFDFKDNIYNMDVIVECLNRIRNEEKFENADQLYKRLKIDKEIALRQIFEHY